MLNSSALSVTAQYALPPEVSAEGECVLPIQTYQTSEQLLATYTMPKLKFQKLTA